MRPPALVLLALPPFPTLAPFMLAPFALTPVFPIDDRCRHGLIDHCRRRWRGVVDGRGRRLADCAFFAQSLVDVGFRHTECFSLCQSAQRA
ncbi:hypothetical protein BG58_18205 [Caballeronia jiangsuensis]|nr:hypothetical protein BG58_18205 [Caballeronia jiangsuensis]